MKKLANEILQQAKRLTQLTEPKQAVWYGYYRQTDGEATEVVGYLSNSEILDLYNHGVKFLIEDGKIKMRWLPKHDEVVAFYLGFTADNYIKWKSRLNRNNIKERSSGMTEFYNAYNCDPYIDRITRDGGER